MVERALFERIDGFDEAFPLDLGDTDLCLRVRAVGRRVVFTPHATVIHHESATRESVGGMAPPSCSPPVGASPTRKVIRSSIPPSLPASPFA